MTFINTVKENVVDNLHTDAKHFKGVRELPNVHKACEGSERIPAPSSGTNTCKIMINYYLDNR